MNRRGFLGAILASGAAPAIVRASSLMPVFARLDSGLLAPTWEPITATDLTLSVDQFSMMYVRPALRAIADSIDGEILAECGVLRPAPRLGETITFRRPIPFKALA